MQKGGGRAEDVAESGECAENRSNDADTGNAMLKLYVLLNEEAEWAAVTVMVMVLRKSKRMRDRKVLVWC